jgi:hypothetical protein
MLLDLLGKPENALAVSTATRSKARELFSKHRIAAQWAEYLR